MQYDHVANIRMILDTASAHCTNKVKGHIQKTNSAGPLQIFLTFIDAELILI